MGSWVLINARWYKALWVMPTLATYSVIHLTYCGCNTFFPFHQLLYAVGLGKNDGR